jgi:hypothetical protein
MRGRWQLGLALAFVVAGSSRLAAQDISGRIVVYGRVQDFASQAPLASARVTAADSSATVFTDSLGNFAIPLARGGRFSVYAEQFGYLVQRFDLDSAAVSRVNVLALEPAPFEIEAIDVEAEAAITRLTRNMRSRRAAASSTVRAWDRTWLDRFGPTGGSVLDLVLSRVPRIGECANEASQLCVPTRFVTFRDPYPQQQILVCINERRSLAPMSDLGNMPVDGVALVEVYGRAHIRVYTPLWLTSRAQMRHTFVDPLWMGC